MWTIQLHRSLKSSSNSLQSINKSALIAVKKLSEHIFFNQCEFEINK